MMNRTSLALLLSAGLMGACVNAEPAPVQPPDDAGTSDAPVTTQPDAATGTDATADTRPAVTTKCELLPADVLPGSPTEWFDARTAGIDNPLGIWASRSGAVKLATSPNSKKALVQPGKAGECLVVALDGSFQFETGTLSNLAAWTAPAATNISTLVLVVKFAPKMGGSAGPFPLVSRLADAGPLGFKGVRGLALDTIVDLANKRFSLTATFYSGQNGGFSLPKVELFGSRAVDAGLHLITLSVGAKIEMSIDDDLPKSAAIPAFDATDYDTALRSSALRIGGFRDPNVVNFAGGIGAFAVYPNLDEAKLVLVKKQLMTEWGIKPAP